VAEKKRLAEMARTKLLRQPGADIRPISIEGREIARTWWGKAWNENLERYADFGNRLPRGRSYVRNGSVLDLRIAATTITAVVAGSRPKPYDVTIRIKPLNNKVRQALMARSRAAMDSMSAMLSGEFPAELKEAFLQKDTGLFPAPGEIEFSCSCPDWASLCKHVAAALYGTAVRLDEKPELFFTLRGMKMDDFIGHAIRRERTKMLRKASVKSARVIEAKEADISKLFGIDLEDGETPDRPAPAAAAPPTARGKKTSKKTVRKPPRRAPAAKPGKMSKKDKGDGSRGGV